MSTLRAFRLLCGGGFVPLRLRPIPKRPSFASRLSTSTTPPRAQRPWGRAFVWAGGLSLGAVGVTVATTDREQRPGEKRPQESLPALVRSYVVYSICSIPPIVKHSPSILSFCFSVPGLKQVTELVVRYTFFDQFVGGETAEDVVPLLEDLRSQKKGVMFGYSVEVDEKSVAASGSTKGATVAQYKKNVNEMIHSIEVAGDFQDRHAQEGPSGKIWVALKLTALLPSAGSLSRFSEHLLNTRPKDPLLHFPGTPHSSDMDVIISGKIPEGSPLTPEDIVALKTLKQDLEDICSRAQTRNIKILVDAEHTWYQPALDAFQLSLMRQFNKPSKSGGSTPLIYGTFQAYLRRNTMHLLRSLELAQREGFVLGVKLVRGAYHSQEHKRLAPYEPDSSAIGRYASSKFADVKFPTFASNERKPPVWDEKYETDAAYNAAASLLLDLMRRPRSPVGVLFATHNKESCDLIIGQLVSKGMAVEDPATGKVKVDLWVADRLAFGQLYGMKNALTDFLSETLVAPMPLACKLIPYGELREVVPYLGRRAIENQSVLGAKAGGAADERRRAAGEIWRRIFG